MTTKRRQLLVRGLLGLAILVSGKDMLLAQEAPPTVSIELVITSGMASPGWAVNDPDELGGLREFVKGLPEAAPIQEPPFGGFLLIGDEAKCRFPARVRVVNGVIIATTADGVTRYFKDTKGFEQFLRREAERRGFGELLP